MPTLEWGIIRGPIRMEALDGSEFYLPEEEGPLYIPPVERGGKMFCVTHLQKKATYFSLRFSPFIYHWGNFWKLQEQNEQGQWVGGTEKGIYIRSPGWRFDFPGTVINGVREHWIFSKGFFGSHLD